MINIWNGTPLGHKKEYDNKHNKNMPLMEEFAIKDGRKHSCFLILPGGGYDHMSDHEGANVAKRLNEKGISAFVLYYRLKPYAHPIYLWDVKRAMRYIRYNADKYSIDPCRIGIMGFSAGGHLSCLCAEHYDNFEYDRVDEIDSADARPDLLCMCYPVVSITKPISHMRSGDNICGGNEDVRDLLSCELNVREDMPHTFIWHTFEDKSVDCRNSLEFALAMKAKEQSFELHIFPKGRHGLDLAEGIEGTKQWFSLFCNWLKREDFII